METNIKHNWVSSGYEFWLKMDKKEGNDIDLIFSYFWLQKSDLDYNESLVIISYTNYSYCHENYDEVLFSTNPILFKMKDVFILFNNYGVDGWKLLI